MSQAHRFATSGATRRPLSVSSPASISSSPFAADGALREHPLGDLGERIEAGGVETSALPHDLAPPLPRPLDRVVDHQRLDDLDRRPDHLDGVATRVRARTFVNDNSPRANDAASTGSSSSARAVRTFSRAAWTPSPDGRRVR
jgi:hypothetical protein